MIFFTHCRVKFQAKDGKGTKFESINPTKLKYKRFFLERKEKGHRCMTRKSEKMFRYLGRSVSCNFLGKPVDRGFFFFPGILSGSFWSKNLKYKCYIKHVASVTLTVAVTRIRTGKRSIIPTKLMIVLVLLRRNNCM